MLKIMKRHPYQLIKRNLLLSLHDIERIKMCLEEHIHRWKSIDQPSEILEEVCAVERLLKKINLEDDE